MGNIYTVRGTPTRIEYPDGTLEKKAYSLDGLLVLEISKNGTSTHYTHDFLGRIILKEIRDISGNPLATTSYSYNSFHLLSETDEEGLTTFYDYDGAGRKISIRKGEHLTEYEYDALGRQTKIKESIGNGEFCITCKAYDLLDRVIEEKVTDHEGKILKQERYGYDVDGNKTRVTLFSHAGISEVIKEYTPHKELSRIIDPLGHLTYINYDYGYLYNGHGVLKITSVDRMGNQEIKIHDTHGNLACQSTLNPFGEEKRRETHFYDSTGKKVESQYFVYNTSEQREPVVNQWEYDGASNLVGLIEAVGTPEEKKTKYRYNSFGQKVRTVLAKGTMLFHEYDSFGRLSRYSSSDGTIDYIYQYDKRAHHYL